MMFSSDNFYEREKFKQAIREIFSERYFIEKVIYDLRIRSFIDDKIRELDQIIPQKMDMILPGKVSQEVIKQLPGIIAENHRMVEIYNKYEGDLRAELEKETKRIIRGIVSDPEYHQINRIYLESFTEKGQKKLKKLSSGFKEEFKSMKTEWEKELMETRENTSRLIAIEKRSTLFCYVLTGLTLTNIGFLFYYFCKR